jgi:hypothetical protein
MRDEEQNLLIALAAFWLWQRYSLDVVPALEKAGARAYDTIHDDSGHQQDLPRPERMEKPPAYVAERIARLTALCKEVGFPNPELAAAIAMAESGGDHTKITIHPGGTGKPGYRGAERSVGLFQINMLAHKGFSEQYLLDPVKNARAALQVSKDGANWQPWSAYTNGTYKRFLP